MNPILPTTLALLTVGGVVAVAFGRRRQRHHAESLERALRHGIARPSRPTVDLDALDALPPPVARYFRHVLQPGQGMIRSAMIRQGGVLRTSLRSDSWSRFTARMLAVPASTGFLWSARVALPVASHVQVLDSYIDGVGAGRVDLLSAWTLASEAGSAELNAGALHRYLAEAVWFPTALLPQAGVEWTPIDQRSARASLSHRGTTVSLEFRFNDNDEVAGIYTSGRYGRFDQGYRQVPWEGHFRDYQVRAGMRVPEQGEVGWHLDGGFQLVWQGRVLDVHYDLET